ncbi:MAG: zf-HC2 domain-containing protein [Deltaproteobacteria bacterium]|jgi:anti-sigma factor RsiW|nr:zf-HC2 domain-containing protein [Deltaproteobacteria bacterium]MBW2535351.1 zf-HC2 domain-containing protein [Deltaproteobacteria bacterium]
MAHDREVGGIRCLQVLEHLADYVDGEVDAELQGRIEAHLVGCDWCERFGGSYGGTVAELRRVLAEPEPLSQPVHARLRARLLGAEPSGGEP